MGTNNIPSASDGTVIPSSDHNALKEALTNALVPRNTSGVATDGGGSLGNSTYPWSDLFLGLSANGVSFTVDGGDIVMKIATVEVFRISSTAFTFKVGGSTVASIDADGVDGAASFTLGNLPQSRSTTFTADGTFNVPDDCNYVVLRGCGGGGAGAGGSFNASGGGGGAGGNGAVPRVVAVPVTPGAAISVSIPNAATGGAENTDGADGGTASFGTLAYFHGGAGGVSGGAVTTGGTATTARYDDHVHTSQGGDGGDITVAGTSGTSSMLGAGGAGGAGQGGGGGGGGGAAFGDGADGGTGGSALGGSGAAGDAATEYGAGGGGGGGASGTGYNGASGGNGGPSIIQVFWVSFF